MFLVAAGLRIVEGPRGMEVGLRTVVGSGGTRLSRGQAQRLTVARNLPTVISRTRSNIIEGESSCFSV